MGEDAAVGIGYHDDERGVLVFVVGQDQTRETVRVGRLGRRGNGLACRAAQAQVGGYRATTGLDGDVAAEAPPRDSPDDGGRPAGSGAFDPNVRDEAFLDAEAAVGVLVALG